MTPLIPVQPAPALAVAPVAVKPVLSGAESSAAPPPILGAQAVTETQATKRTEPRDEDRARLEPLEIPPDPPPLKGLGIPGLHTALVGDFDKLEDLQSAPQKAPSFSETLNAINGSDRPMVDVKR